MSKRIITSCRYPPIPDRQWDWCAYHEDDEECFGHYGWGRTKQEAIDDLRRLDQERAEAAEEEKRIDLGLLDYVMFGTRR